MGHQVPMGWVHRHKEFGPKPTLGAAAAYPQNKAKIGEFQSHFSNSHILLSFDLSKLRSHYVVSQQLLIGAMKWKIWFSKICITVVFKNVFFSFFMPYLVWCQPLRNVSHIFRIVLTQAIPWYLPNPSPCIFLLNKILKILFGKQ